MINEKEELRKLHNTLLNGLSSLEYINENKLNEYDKEKLSTIKTMIVDEINSIRKELKINTVTGITEEDLEKIQN